MIVASIDIGTNTVLLLIAEVDLTTKRVIPLINEYRMPRIGKGIKETGNITAERLSLLYSFLEEYNGIIESYSCEKIIVTGTNAFRIANNTSFIIKEIREKFNFELNVISGDEEANYAYLGAISGLDSANTSLVIDIGGSSTEIISGDGNEINSKTSLQLGSVSSTEQFLKQSPPLKTELDNLKKEIQKKIATIKLKKLPRQVIAIAGTATTLACMISGLKNFDERIVNNFIITKEVLTSLVQELSSLTNIEILEKYGPVMKGREDIILAGAYILLQIIEFFQIKSVQVNTRGIRYGAIINYITHLKSN
jgi:exopolyphosphatase / guanosine-5'-triphosphate,3'-diphosphate pyrophosphatase